MARFLITRAEPDAEETAQRLRALGHSPIVAPLRTLETIRAASPATPPRALIATSRNAFAGAPMPEAWRALPLYCVGVRTAEAARKVGFSALEIADGDVASLLGRIVGEHQRPGRLVYLAGAPRRPELEDGLRALGCEIEVLLRYRMHSVPALPTAAARALEERACDAVLHFSAESAQVFFALAKAARLEEAARSVLHACLSPEIAGTVEKAAGGAVKTLVAPEKTGGSLIQALDSRFN